MKSVFSKYGCSKCGKTTVIRWLPGKDTYAGQNAFTPDELKARRSKTPKRIDKPVPCHYCKAILYTAPDEIRDFEDVTSQR